MDGVRVDLERGQWISPTVLEAQAREAANRVVDERFGSYAATWVAQRVVKGRLLSAKTRAEYARQLEKGLSRFKNDRVSEITAARVRNWHADRMKAGRTAAGAEARLLRAIMNTAIVEGIVTSNPVPSDLTKTSAGMKQTYRPPTLGELGSILDFIDDRFELAILLAAYGGLRMSEWRALRRMDITIRDGVTTVEVSRQAQRITGEGWVVGSPKSEEGMRAVVLPSALTPAVEAHLSHFAGRFPESLLFQPHGHSEFVDNSVFYKEWNRVRDLLSIRGVVREHDLRRFAGTLHAQSGATLAETMKFLGHSTTVAAMAYQHAAADRLAEIAERMPVPTRT
ncbi:hypothetical protein ATC03_07950 [Agromyces aureus]|uniref:Tyr recombinase domain-containing protein n=1 Tax=Agromyces aureus TaxID=453304 RepID=A0A191WEN4_9MICO|nr:hypothetical protein ATC03_07950 [Agromyces aureus]